MNENENPMMVGWTAFFEISIQILSVQKRGEQKKKNEIFSVSFFFFLLSILRRLLLTRVDMSGLREHARHTNVCVLFFSLVSPSIFECKRYSPNVQTPLLFSFYFFSSLVYIFSVGLRNPHGGVLDFLSP